MADEPREGHPLAYKEKFSVGTWIRIKEQPYEKFKAEWKYHHPIQPTRSPWRTHRHRS